MAREDYHGDGYDPEVIYAGPAKDEQGHSANFRVHVPSDWAGFITEIEASRDWPEYSSTQAFVRDAIYHRMHWAMRQRNRQPNERMRELWAQVRMAEEANHRELVREGYLRLREKIDKVCRDGLADGDRQGVLEMLRVFEEELENFKEPYHSELGEKITTWKKRALS